MIPLNNIRHHYVEYIPEKLDSGILYISKRFRTATHLCCCGCGLKVVTPLNPAKWRLIDHGTSISLCPSIGNWNYPCSSHYLIVKNSVKWAGQLNKRQIDGVQRRDRIDVAKYSSSKNVRARLTEAFKRLFE